MQIRRATTADATDIAKLAEQYWAMEGIGGFEHSRVAAQLRELLSKPEHGLAWIAVSDGRACGYLLAVFIFSLEHGGLMAEIDEFFVTPALRSAGVGSLLLAAAQHDLQAAGTVRLQLQLNIDNERGRQFYQRNGFERRADYELYEKPL
jgi:GNAT superfamily N-acetyltransferase